LRKSYVRKVTDVWKATDAAIIEELGMNFAQCLPRGGTQSPANDLGSF
jgi:hypothetical protein